MNLSHYCKISTTLRNADFYLTCVGSRVGDVSKERRSQNDMGIRVKAEYLPLLNPDFLYLFFMLPSTKAFFQHVARGTCQQFIGIADVKKILFVQTSNH